MGKILADWTSEAKEQALPELSTTKNGVIYVSQDNYIRGFCPRNGIFYADSATSCIIIIVKGTDKLQRPAFCMSHLSRPGRFQNFFGKVTEFITQDISVYMAGANPPQRIKNKKGDWDYTALNNATQVMDWVSALKRSTRLIQVSARFGEGDPSKKKNNLDCLGINFSTGVISNERHELSLEDRDPTGGAQTLFCIFGNPQFIRPAQSFSKGETDELVRKAREKNFQEAAHMTDREILDKYSSTPEFEVEWFCETIRAAGKYTEEYSL